jgi:hypothetical protein
VKRAKPGKDKKVDIIQPFFPLAYLLLLLSKAAQDGDYKNLEKITRKVLFLISYIKKWVIQSMEML